MSKTKLTATDSFSETFTRNTARDYKFVVVTRGDQQRVEFYRATLAEYTARLDEIGQEGIERAEGFADRCWELRREALAAGDYSLARKLDRKRAQYLADSNLNVCIAYTEKDLARSQEDAAARKVISITWTSRNDLALKEAGKMQTQGTVEIVPVG